MKSTYLAILTLTSTLITHTYIFLKKCYLISTGPSTFVLHIQLCCNKIFVFSKILFHWYGTYLICAFHDEAQVDLGH